MIAGPQRRFADADTESRYQLMARTLRQPFVRLYGLILFGFVMVYSIVNPIFVTEAEIIALSLCFGAMLIVLGGYVGATMWEGYPGTPAVDFIALLGLSFLVALANATLFDHFIHVHASMHAIGSINRLIVTAFAAVALAGRFRLFLVWLSFDFLIFQQVALHAQTPGAGMIYAVLSYAGGALVMLAINLAIEGSSRAAFSMSEALDKERAKNEDMLHNVLPPVAARRLKEGLVVADSYGDTTVVFIDIVGFSMLAKRVSPGHLIELLNAFFSLADACAKDAGVEKVKTIGDAYLAISGGNSPSANSAVSAIRFACAVIDGLAPIRAATGIDIHIRIGIHSGPVVGGVIGETRMAYDYWGETMNIAARIEGTASPDGIAVSDACYMRARTHFSFAEPETLLLKGVGETLVYKLDRQEAAMLAQAA